jgi:hypothetical protein
LSGTAVHAAERCALGEPNTGIKRSPRKSIGIHITNMNVNKKFAAVTLIVNLLLSSTLLPLVISPGRIYSIKELIEVILWQIIGIFVWPLSITGFLITLPFQGNLNNLDSFLLLLMYPILLLLFILVFIQKYPKLWAFVLMHIILILSFAVIWYQVINGYNFMNG